MQLISTAEQGSSAVCAAAMARGAEVSNNFRLGEGEDEVFVSILQEVIRARSIVI